ncbi:hypothetical protein K469DRAFT_460860, partial [Zopfia rhizophila CBS 207.26]
VRGDGLVMAERALASLVEDPQRLDRARTRFSDSPPSYKSHQSHNSTRSQSPNPPSEEQRRREERRVQLRLERWASLPYEQFEAQHREEEERIYEAHENRTRRLHAGTNIYQLAYENVKKRWVEQGIWNDKWNKTALGRWKHEEPLELESELETDTEAGPQSSLFTIFPQPKPRRPISDEEKRRRIAERRATLEREREASRPFYQFIYQVSKERERIQDESGSGKAITTTTASADINTRAYENVNNTWIKRGIWNRNWGILPGMSWKHEEPLEEETADGPATVQANLLGNSSHEVGGASIITMNGAPLRYISGRSVANLLESGIFMRNPPTAESNNRQGCNVIIDSQQEPSADVNSPGLENGDVEYSPSESNSAPPRRGKRLPRPTAGQAARPSRRRPPHGNGQTQPVASASLGPVHLSKVSKTPIKKRPGPRRRPNASEEVPSGDPPLLAGPDITEPLLQSASMLPRRSKRLQRPESSMAKDPGGIASTDSLKGISRSRLKRNVAGNSKSVSSAKPQGISKRQGSRTTR